MTNPLLGRTTSPAERANGCFLSYSFKNRHDVVLDGGTINGAPVVDNGVELNGTTDYVLYGLSGEFNLVEYYSFHVIFYPNFNYDKNDEHRVFTTTGGKYTVNKRNNANSNVIRISVGGSNIDIPQATYSDLWKVGNRNLLSFWGISGNNNAAFNTLQVVTSDATAWTFSNDVQLAIGTTVAGTQFFDGKIEMLKFYNSLLTFEDHKNLYYSGDY